VKLGSLHKVLITGASGLLGRALVSLTENSYEVLATLNNNSVQFSRSKAVYLDITDRKTTLSVVENFSPDVIIHAAAYTNVDMCETNRREAYRVNVEGTRNIVSASNNIGSKIVYVSTDYVFDGKNGLYKEYDETRPVNYYGLTKLQGENVVKENCVEFIIVRTSVLFGWSKLNFVTWILNELRGEREVKVITDQFNSPTLNIDLAEQITKLLEADEHGVFHTAGATKISRFDFACKIAKIFQLDNHNIIPIKSSELNWIAQRPMDSSLDISRISKIKKPLSVDEALKRMREVE
jgi:dTDP-4-dehydrorhamnose reductase